MSSATNPLVRLIRGEITVEQYVASVKERVADQREQAAEDGEATPATEGKVI